MQFGISEAVEHWGKYRPENIALTCDGINTTYSQLNNYINLTCNHLNKIITDEQRVGLAVNNKPNFIVGLLSILRMGKSVVVFNVGLPNEALKVNIQDTEVKSIIYDVDKIKTLENKQFNAFNIGDILKEDENDNINKFSTVYRQPSDEWGIVFSSGTTGIPKGIERDHNSIITELIGWCLELGLYKKTCFYIGRPVFYTGGLVLTLSMLMVSGKVILNNFNDDNDPSEVWKDYQKTLNTIKVDWSFFVPNQIQKFNSYVKENNISPKSAYNILTMGAPISGNDKKDVKENLKSEIVESWGNSESLGTITDQEDIYVRPDSIGRPFLTDEMAIVNDNGEEIDQGEYGRIAGSQEAGFLKYSNRPNETHRVKKHNLIISDDIGYIDQAGYFYVCGRRQDVILTSHKTIFIPNLEEKLRKSSFVDECCIISRTFDDSSYQLFGIVVLKKNLQITNYDLKQKFNQGVDKEENLEEIFIVKSIPKLPSGKIDKITLEKQLL